MLLTFDERESKIARNSVVDCHLSPVGINVFDCRLSGLKMLLHDAHIARSYTVAFIRVKSDCVDVCSGCNNKGK